MLKEFVFVVALIVDYDQSIQKMLVEVTVKVVNLWLLKILQSMNGQIEFVNASVNFVHQEKLLLHINILIVLIIVLTKIWTKFMIN